MEQIALASCLTLLILPNTVTSADPEQHIEYRVLTGSLYSRVLDPIYVGHTIDASIVTKPEWKQINFSDPTLLSLMRGILPTYIRFGGIVSDYTTFRHAAVSDEERPLKKRSKVKKKKVKGAGKEQDQPQVLIGSPDIDRLLSFVRSINSRLLYCLNSNHRIKRPDGTEVWNSTNAIELLDYIGSRGSDSCVDYSIGNEPHKRDNVTGKLLGNAIRELRAALNKRNLKDTHIVGPDANRLFRGRITFQAKLIREVLDVALNDIDAVSFHQYYGDSRILTWKDLVHPETLALLGDTIAQAQASVDRSKRPDIPLWISESGSTYGGGTAGLSRAYPAAISFLDKLGTAAVRNVHFVMRQSLFGGEYKLLDPWNFYEPSPEYWVILLFRRFTGGCLVRRIKTDPPTEYLRAYAFEYRTNSSRSFRILFMNIHPKQKFVIWPAAGRLRNATRLDYVIRPVGHASVATEIMVNGVVLELIGSEMPRMPAGIPKFANESLVLKPYEMAFSQIDMTPFMKKTDDAKSDDGI